MNNKYNPYKTKTNLYVAIGCLMALLVPVLTIGAWLGGITLLIFVVVNVLRFCNVAI